MWFECDAEEVRENGRRSFEERKRNSKGPAEFVVVRLHIDRERKLGAKGARDTQRRGDWSGGNPARRRVSASLHRRSFSYRSFVARLPQRMAPRGFVETPLSFRRPKKQITRGAQQAPTPTKLFLRKLSARPALPS